MAEELWQNILSIMIILGLGFIIYTRIKNQTMRDTYDEFLDLTRVKQDV